MKSERRKFGMILAFDVLFAMLAFVSAGCAGGIPPEEEWNKTFGGTNGELAFSVAQTSDDGYIITGRTKSYGAGSDDVWLIKTNSNGDEIWNKTFGGTDYDSGGSVAQTSDGGYIITGETVSYGVGDYDVWLIKTDNNGNEMWNKTFGGTDYDSGHSVEQTPDGGYIIGAYTVSYGAGNGDIWLIKTDSTGNEMWNTTFGGNYYDDIGSLEEISNDGYIITGGTYSYGAGNGDVWLIKTDNNGNEMWNKTFGGANCDDGQFVEEISYGGYIIVGGSESYGAGSDELWLIETDSNGNEVWNMTFGGTNWDCGLSVAQTSDGGYITTGGTFSYGMGNRDVWLIKIGNNGDEIWNKTFGGTDSDWGNSVAQTSDGGFIITGVTFSYGAGNSDVWLIKVKGEPTISIFDTESSKNPYPSIMGTHKGEIKPSQNINVSKLYTYPCAGTGGHTESIKLYENDTLIASGTWNGYQDDWHNITITPSVTLLAGHTYDYTIVTGSYPQIIHAKSKDVIGGTITCTSFVGANGKTYTDWIPAIRLE